jgi:hypothetical protein
MSNSYFAIIIVFLLCRNPAVETAATQTKKLHPFFFSAIIFSCLGGGVLAGVALLIARKVLKPSSAQTSLPSPQNQLPSGDM